MSHRLALAVSSILAALAVWPAAAALAAVTAAALGGGTR